MTRSTRRIAARSLCSAIAAALLSLPAVSRAEANDTEVVRFAHPLSTNAYNCGIIQDKDGFLWIGSSHGLFKYDGYTATNFTAGPDALSSNYVGTIFEDSEGLLWLGTMGGGLTVYDKRTHTFTQHKHDSNNPNSLLSDQFNWAPNTIAEDQQGLIWLGTQGGLSSFDKKTKQLTHYRNDPAKPDSLLDNNVWTVRVDRRNRVWVGTQAGLCILDKATGRFTHYKHDAANPGGPRSLAKGGVYAVLEDRDGILWIGMHAGGLARLDPTSDTIKQYRHADNDPTSLAHDEVYSLVDDTQGHLWIGRSYNAGGVGLERFDKKSEKFTVLRHSPDMPDGLSSNAAINATVDRTGTLWVVEDSGHVEQFDPIGQRFRWLRNEAKNARSLPDNNVQVIHEDSSNVVWVGTQLGGLARYNRAKGDFDVFAHDDKNPDSLSNNFVFSLLEDRDGSLWVSTADGMLSVFDRQTGKVVRRYKNEAASVGGRGLRQDALDPNLLWYGTEGQGVIRFDKRTGQFTQLRNDPNDPASLSNNMVLGLYQDRDGALWAPTSGGGLNQLDRKTGKFVRYEHNPSNPDSISGSVIHAVIEDKNGVLWVSTADGGLNKLDRKTGKFTRYGKKQGFTTNTLIHILEANDGHLWVSSDAGVFRFDPRAGRVDKHYRKVDGLQGDKFNAFIDSGYRTRAGEIWMAGIAGLTVFVPEQIRDNASIPPIVFTALKQGGEDMPLGAAFERVQTLHLPWWQNYFEFEFAALNYVVSEKNEYAFILDGLDRDWYHAGTRRFGRYSNLPGGTYTLRVKGSNNDGVWNEQGTALKVIVDAPFWQTWWFRTLVAASAASLLTLLYLWRTHKMRQFNRELIARVDERTRELEEANSKIVKLEKESLEQQMAGGFAHEMRNALAGSVIVMDAVIDGQKTLCEKNSELLGSVFDLVKNNLGGKDMDSLVEVLETIDGNEELVDRVLKTMHQCSDRALRVTSLILEYARLGTLGRGDAELDVGALVEKFASEHRASLTERNISLKIVKTGEATLRGDEQHVYSIVSNLAFNARDALLAVEDDRERVVTIGVERQNGVLTLTVSDNAGGIAEGNRRRIFEPFYSTKPTTGLGLGLNFVSKLVSLYDGKVDVDSAVGTGSTFKVTLLSS